MAQLQALFLHHLVVDRTGGAQGLPHYRAGDVKQCLDSHPEIDRFGIIDDRYRTEFDRLFPDHLVHTGSFIDETEALRAHQILSGGPVTDACAGHGLHSPYGDRHAAAFLVAAEQFVTLRPAFGAAEITKCPSAAPQWSRKALVCSCSVRTVTSRLPRSSLHSITAFEVRVGGAPAGHSIRRSVRILP